MIVAFRWALALLASGLAQQEPPPVVPNERGNLAEKPQDFRSLQWKEGIAIPIRVPVASPTHHLMTAVAFPEESFETAITGWGEGEITAIQKKGLLFLRLSKKSEGQLNIVGNSGTHYLLYLEGTEASDPKAYDAYLRITRPKPSLPPETQSRRSRKPVGSLALIQAMRLGGRPDGARILRANRELAFESDILQIRLLFVYKHGPYAGLIHEVTNRSSVSQAVDASRFRSKGAPLILSALKDNVLGPKKSTRLFTVFWRN